MPQMTTKRAAELAAEFLTKYCCGPLGEPDFDCYIYNRFYIEVPADTLHRDLTQFLAARFDRI